MMIDVLKLLLSLYIIYLFERQRDSLIGKIPIKVLTARVS